MKLRIVTCLLTKFSFRVQLLQVTKIRDQCTMQEETIKEQTTELDAKKSELQSLKDEENALETEHKNSTAEMDNMTKNLQDTQLQISQVRGGELFIFLRLRYEPFS